MTVDDDKFIRAVALLADIHRHLAAGRSIHPNNTSVLNGTHKVPDWCPTLTDYVAGVLRELDADKVLA